MTIILVLLLAAMTAALWALLGPIGAIAVYGGSFIFGTSLGLFIQRRPWE